MPRLWAVRSRLYCTPALVALLLAGCGRAPLEMTPTVDGTADTAPSALMDAARSLSVVDEGGSEACLIDMAYRGNGLHRRHQACLQVIPADDARHALLLRTACGRMATINIAAMQASETFDVHSTHLRLRRACPPAPQFRCSALEGSTLTLFGYDQPADELAQARAGCQALGGVWHPG